MCHQLISSIGVTEAHWLAKSKARVRLPHTAQMGMLLSVGTRSSVEDDAYYDKDEKSNCWKSTYYSDCETK